MAGRRHRDIRRSGVSGGATRLLPAIRAGYRPCRNRDWRRRNRPSISLQRSGQRPRRAPRQDVDLQMLWRPRPVKLAGPSSARRAQGPDSSFSAAIAPVRRHKNREEQRHHGDGHCDVVQECVWSRSQHILDGVDQAAVDTDEVRVARQGELSLSSGERPRPWRMTRPSEVRNIDEASLSSLAFQISSTRKLTAIVMTYSAAVACAAAAACSSR